MSDAPHPRLEELLAAALERTPEDRTAFLDEACRGDSKLREELNELLGLHAQADGFFEDLAGEIAEAGTLELETATRPKIRIGPYQAEEAIGRGGMGVVYRARRVDGEFDHQVALKLLHLDMHTPQVRARFVTERQLLAKFQHPNIGRLLDGGVTDEGRPYFVMELIDGQPITTYCREQQLPLDETLRLFLQVTEAVRYLHRNLVVHRDLKPSNIFVRRDGVVKLLDFGVAKLLGEDTDSNARTITGEQLLTPQYAAPEQLTNGQITTATDVYGLGVVLFELLSGHRPPDRSTLAGETPRSETTTSPNQALRRARSETAQESQDLPWHRLPKDLDNICSMALRPEPERRYASAYLLGQDIERHLAGHPVAARAGTITYRLSKFAQRQRKGIAAILALLALIGFGFVRERTLRDQAQQEASKAQAVSDFLGTLISSADPANAQGREVTVADVLGQAEAELAEGDALTSQPAVESEVRIVLGETYDALGKISEAEIQFERALELAGGIGAENATAMASAEALGRSRTVDIERREELLRRVVEVRRRTLGAEHEDTLSAMGGLSRVVGLPGRYPEAEALDREILAKRRRALGPDHPDTLRAINSLAGTLFNTARYAEAAKLYEDALALARVRLGPSHPDTLRLASNLGASHSALGRYREAEPLHREVVVQRLRILGEDHHQTGMSMHNLAFTLTELGELQEAESWFRRAVLARADARPGGYLYSKSFLADTVRDLGRLDEAEEIYLETLERQEELLVPDHPDVFRTVGALAELRYLQGDLDSAEGLASQALEGQLLTQGEKQLDAIETLNLLARIHLARGQFEDAPVLADRAISIATEFFDSDDPAVLRTRIEKVGILLGVGEVDRACKGLESLFDDLVSSPSLEGRRLQEPLVLAIGNCQATGSLQDAERFSVLLR